jgi:hypothetical protein
MYGWQRGLFASLHLPIVSAQVDLKRRNISAAEWIAVINKIMNESIHPAGSPFRACEKALQVAIDLICLGSGHESSFNEAFNSVNVPWKLFVAVSD